MTTASASSTRNIVIGFLLFIVSFAASAAPVIFKDIQPFTSTEVGQTSEMYVTLKNRTRRQVRLDSFWFNSSNSFSITGGTCKFNDTVLKAKSTCSVAITFTPTDAGTINDSVTFGYFKGTGNRWAESSLSLSAVATRSHQQPPAPTPTDPITFMNEANYGDVEISKSKTILITIKNTNNIKLRLDSNWLTDTEQFSITGGTCNFNEDILEVEATCSIDVSFNPTSAGSKNSSLFIGYYEGSDWYWLESSIDMTGTGIEQIISPPPPSDPPTPIPTPAGWLSVQGNKILDSNGAQVILKGVNIADPEHLDTKYWERPNVTARSIASLATKTYFAQVVRIPILPGNANYPDEGWFSDTNGRDKYFANHIKPLVDELTAQGTYVIIDLHYVADYQNLYPKVAEFWSFIAPKFKDNPHVFYEIFNEPIFPDNWNTWKDTIAQPATDLIRSLAPNNIILVGGPYWSSHMAGAATNPVTGSNIVYVGHIYANQSPTAWAKNYEPVLTNAPMMITEWGFEQGGTEGGDLTYGVEFEAWMKANNLSWTVWNFDTLWGPRMFNEDWTLKGGTGGMGVFIKDLLIEHRNQTTTTSQPF